MLKIFDIFTNVITNEIRQKCYIYSNYPLFFIIIIIERNFCNWPTLYFSLIQEYFCNNNLISCTKLFRYIYLKIFCSIFLPPTFNSQILWLQKVFTRQFYLYLLCNYYLNWYYLISCKYFTHIVFQYMIIKIGYWEF